jgi:hypothetical protein
VATDGEEAARFAAEDAAAPAAYCSCAVVGGAAVRVGKP